MEVTDELVTPRSGRKKKSLLSKMAERKARVEDNSSTQECERNGSTHLSISPEESSLTQVSIDQTPTDQSAPNKSNPVLHKHLVQSVESPKSESPRPRPRNRIRQSFDLNHGHWKTGDDEESGGTSPLVSSEDEVDGDTVHHQVQVHRETRRSSTHDTNHRPVNDDSADDDRHKNGSRRYRRQKTLQTTTRLSDSESEDQLRTEYENILAKSSPNNKRLELTQENLRVKESLENDEFDLDSTFTRTNRLQRLTHLSRGAAGTPSSELSTKTFLSHSSLPAITTKSVRERSFLVGSMGPNSVLGAEELERLFPDRRIRVFVVTWNMFQNKPENLPASLNDIVLPEEMEYLPDLCVVHTQESCADKREWEVRLQETIGPTHVLYVSAYHGDLQTCVFIRRDLIWYCTVPEWDKMTFRPAVRTKGSLALAFSFFGTSFLFLNSHFMSGDGRLNDRISDYKETITKTKLPANPTRPFHQDVASDVTARYDVVFWGGDMNFRIVRPRHIVDTIVNAIQEHHEHPDYEELLVGCELYRCKNEGPQIPGIGLLFQQFQEGRINFPPTYKYDVNEEHLYDTSEKMRIPSYCDRILFRTKKKEGVVCLYYSSVDNIKVSDHHPVCGLYEVEVRPGRESDNMAPGKFNRDVYMEANRRRGRFRVGDVTVANEKRSSICSVS